MNCNKGILCWINPSWVNEELYQNDEDQQSHYDALKQALIEKQPLANLKELLSYFRYFPHQTDETIYVIGLIYLTKFEDEVNIYPFTAKQEKIIKISNQTDKTASYWLNIGGILSCAAAGAAGCVPNYWNSIPACISASLGCLATGKYPDLSSNAANIRQNSYHLQIQEMYQNLAQELIKMKSYDLSLATEIANHLNIRNICDALKSNLNEMETIAVIRLIEEAKEFILTNKIPHHDGNLCNAAKVVVLEEKVNNLEKLTSELLNKLKIDEYKSVNLQRVSSMTSEEILGEYSFPVKLTMNNE